MNAGFGDMSSRLVLQRQSKALRQTTATLAQEVTTGQVQDKARHLQGELSGLAAIDRIISRAASRSVIGQSMASILSAQQQSITALRDSVQGGFDDLLSLKQAPNALQSARSLAMMETRFEDMVAVLNTSFGDRFVFSGVRADSPAVANASTLLDALVNDITTASPALSSAQEVSDFIDSWFAKDGGFDAIGYTGGEAIPAAQQLTSGISERISVTAQHEALRQTFAAFAKGAVLSRGVFEGTSTKHSELTKLTLSALANARPALVQLAAEIGTSEERVSRAITQNEAERYAMKIARAEMLGADPYDRASRLEQAMLQQEMIYSLTARLSRLTLSDFLR